MFYSYGNICKPRTCNTEQCATDREHKQTNFLEPTQFSFVANGFQEQINLWKYFSGNAITCLTEWQLFISPLVSNKLSRRSTAGRKLKIVPVKTKRGMKALANKI